VRAVASIVLAMALVACSPAKAPPLASLVLHGTDGARVSLDAALRAHPVTVVTFFSAHCPCQRAHDARLRALIAMDQTRDVGFLVVDSEQSTTPDDDKEEARLRGYPILLDDAGKLARALDAEYATYSVVLDGAGNVLYRGGFDSDRAHLRDDRAAYLADAIDDVLARRPVRRAEAKALGCTLQLR
jgi:hypothetical protein